jgi:hypothetical protein
MNPEEITNRQIIEPYLLDPQENYPEPYYMLEFNGIPFSTLGGIQALSGQKKNGKTFVLAQLMAAVLATGCDRVNTFLPGLRVPQRTLEHLGHLPKVLYIDTEMEKLNSAKVLRRVHWLCDWPMSEKVDRFNVLRLRSVTDDKDENGKTIWKAYQKRWYIIRAAIEELQPDIVFIDGLRDIIGDFNDNTQSASLVGDLMALAEEKHICIWGVLHMNPRPSNDDESKMRGHLGTELGNKVTDTLVSIKKKDNNGRVLFTVKQMDARGKDLDDWQFEVTDAAGALGVPRIVGNIVGIDRQQREDVEGDDPEDIKNWIIEGIHKYHFPMTRSDVKKLIFGEIGGQKNSGKQQADLNIAINLGYLENSTIKSGNGSYMVQPPEDLVF